MRAWEFKSDKDVQSFWLAVREVPGRSQGRTTKQYERYYLALYLLALADHRLLSYPLKAEHGDSPDFILTCESGERRGLEITRATDEELQRWMSQSPIGSAAMASVHSYAGDQIEQEWCRTVRQAVAKKLITSIPKYRPASYYDLLLPDDTRVGAGDRRKVLDALIPWARDLRLRTPKLGKLSAVVSLDVIYDIGGDSLILPYIEWSAPAAQEETFSDRVGHSGRIATLEAIRSHKAAGSPIYFIDGKGRLVKETADGRRFEIQVLEDGQELTLRELSRG